MYKYFEFEKSIEIIDKKIEKLQKNNLEENITKIKKHNIEKKNYLKKYILI